METLTNPTPVSDPPAATRSPRWFLLEPCVNNNDSEPSIPDAKTTAASCTSTGQSFSVSFAPAAPPATSTYCCEWIGGSPGDGDGNDDPDDEPNFTGDDESKNLHIVAVHDNCALIQMTPPESRFYSRYDNTCDYFLYEAGAGRTPCLSLLPGCYFSKQLDRDDNLQVPSRITDTPRSLDASNTALLRLVDGELLVGQLGLIRPYDTADLCVLRPAGREWEIVPLTIAHHDGGSKLPRYPHMDAALAVGVRFMCWVDYNNGFYLRDMEDDETSPNKLLYVPLPVPLPEEHRRKTDRPYLPYRRNLGAAGLNAVRFVSIDPRCCCGGYGKTSCERSRFAFNVTTWTMTLKEEGPMAWVKDDVLDCAELWQLPNYGCLPRVSPEYPIVSADNPDVICFMLCEDHYLIDDADKTVWLLEIDTKRKALLSVVRHGTSGYYIDSRVPVKLCW